MMNEPLIIQATKKKNNNTGKFIDESHAHYTEWKAQKEYMLYDPISMKF